MQPTGDPATDPGMPGPARDEQAAQAALDSVDVTRLLTREPEDVLLPGESVGGIVIEDIQHWIAVYSELLEFKRFMLDGATARQRAMITPDAREEIETTDLRVARAEAERFTRRLSYWRSRLEEFTLAEAAG